MNKSHEGGKKKVPKLLFGRDGPSGDHLTIYRGHSNHSDGTISALTIHPPNTLASTVVVVHHHPGQTIYKATRRDKREVI
ncbi:hypothetical protein ACOMHN_004731 [Nucella lapillus]